jgi:hypothetical protein
MRKEIGVLLMEDEKGEIGVQLFSEIAGSSSAFDNLSGKPGDKPTRATFLAVRYDGYLNVEAKVKNLPIVESVEDMPDGYIMGEGPVHFPKDEGEKK